VRDKLIPEHEESGIEEPQTCESPEPMSCYLHHDPDHPMSSFSVINKMRVNIQVRQLNKKKIRYSCPILLCYHCYQMLYFCFKYNSQLCDVSLRVGNSVTKAHRLVLASSSPYFYAMFNGEWNKFFVFLIKTYLFIFNRWHGWKITVRSRTTRRRLGCSTTSNWIFIYWTSTHNRRKCSGLYIHNELCQLLLIGIIHLFIIQIVLP